MFTKIIHVNVKLKESQSFGSSVREFDKYSRGAKDYYSLAKEVLTQEKEKPPLKDKMQELINRHLGRLTEVTVKTILPTAKEVYIAGDFNGWRLNKEAAMTNDNGSWVKRLRLKSGLYHYRFIADGKWITDPDNPSKEENPYGEFDSLLMVSPAKGDTINVEAK